RGSVEDAGTDLQEMAWIGLFGETVEHGETSVSVDAENGAGAVEPIRAGNPVESSVAAVDEIRRLETVARREGVEGREGPALVDPEQRTVPVVDRSPFGRRRVERAVAALDERGPRMTPLAGIEHVQK